MYGGIMASGMLESAGGGECAESILCPRACTA